MNNSTAWHFYIMIAASLVLFLLVIRLVVGRHQFIKQCRLIVFLAFLVVVIGMLLGKYGANFDLPWWIYYPVPLLMTLLLPPIVLKLNRQQTILYLLISVVSAPAIHAAFSFLLGWKEYMPFWNIPSLHELML